METISTLASHASNAIWGENNSSTQSGTEPLSGERGSGTTSDPYDHGNQEENPPSTTETTKAPSSGLADTSAENRTGPSEATSSDNAGDPSSSSTVPQKQQGADRPNEEPSSSDSPKIPHTDAEREKLMETGGEFPRDPNDHSGEPLKMHDDVEKHGDDETSEKKDRSQSVSQEGGNPHGKSMGTGEQYVKSSGMPADGGDFDASNPGAGQEATRLMEEKGIKSEGSRGPPEPVDDEPAAKGVDHDKVKVSKIDKIKEKLHLKK